MSTTTYDFCAEIRKIIHFGWKKSETLVWQREAVLRVSNFTGARKGSNLFCKGKPRRRASDEYS